MSEKAQSTQTGLRSKLVRSSELAKLTNAKPLSQDEYDVQFEREASAFET
ncbi:hypothetical protein H8E77_02430, partial [bacterium]|nr:hypothetical protein [bacterium]